MRWRDAISPMAMTRIAVVAPAARVREALVVVADEGTVELDRIVPPADLPVGDAARALQRLAPGVPPHARLAPTAPDLDTLEDARDADLLAGEAGLAEQSAQAVVRDEVACLIGWTPTGSLDRLRQRLAAVGAAAAPLSRPAGVEPPTATGDGTVRRAFAPLVTTYGTVPYADLDPTVAAGLSYAVMFGAMFGDVGHGGLLLLGALLIRWGRWRRLAPLRPHWLLVAAAAVSATAFGFAYGECFGPTGWVPQGLLVPTEQPVQMLVAGVALGAVLLGVAYAMGTVNRIREGGWAVALYAPSGIAGALLFVAAGVAAGAWFWHWAALAVGAVALGLTALVLAYVGLFVRAGGKAAGALQATVETVDLVVRLGSNVVSFARLAAFGLTHAILTGIVWDASRSLWGAGPAAAVLAVVVFALGNAVAFALEALVAGIQALRLEYYELFSRVFQLEGRPFRPWHIAMERPVASLEEE
jgi:V/A-type H+/Na+-transporting ATPase subunit I